MEKNILNELNRAREIMGLDLISEEQLNEIEKMLDKMEDDEDVQYVFTNIA